MSEFVHLHVHTEYSMLDGAARLDDLFAKAAQMGMPALAMTDHGNVYGAYDFYKRGIAAGVKPIIGMEGYYAPQGRKTRAAFDFGAPVQGSEEDAGGGRQYYSHATLWAENNEGMANLFRLSSLASIEGYYYKPRFDLELLAKYGKGLIATTGCPSGEVNRWLQVGNFDKAVETAATMQEVLGKDNYFVELMDHGLPIERRTREELLRLARHLNLPLVATNDLHYVAPEDAASHDILLCIQTRAQVDDPNRFRFDADDFYLKSAAEMRATWSELPEACDNTLLIAERCNVSFIEGADLLPRFPVPDGHTEASWLAAKVHQGLANRFAGESVPERYRTQADYELAVIEQMGFPGYFLVVADLCEHAREVGIRVGPGRGSAAGAIIAWALRITELDPIEHGLVFERFLNPERISMPDIDIDFDERRRAEMIRYATDKYGDDRVAQIITYGTIKAKAAVKDAARVLGKPFAVGDRITKAIPPAIMGKDIPLYGIFDPEHPRYGEAQEFRDLYTDDAEVREVVDAARGIEGLKRQVGVHAAGVILCREPLLDVLPVWRRDQDGAIITQFDMGACEALGLLKMDFLGLRNLTVLDDALANIKANRGQEVVLEELELTDKATYALLARGDTLGVFQLDSGPIRSLLRSMVPDNFNDISATIALYRPGPMGANAHNDYADYKNHRKPLSPIHPELASALAGILDDTYGLIVYQEQVMTIAQELAGYTLGQADLLRRAMGKKKAEILAKEYVPFQAGMRQRGYSDGAIEALWNVLVPFSDYAFNKAHSAGYGLISYWTAYLKANYAPEYMAALLTSVRDDKDKSAIYLSECRRMDIKVLPPDVNSSVADFAAVGSDIRFGLAAVRNVGRNVVEAIVKARTEKGAFTSFADFLAKVDVTVCNKRVIDSLIRAGAFDSLGHTRKGLAAVHAEAIDSAVVTKRAEAVGQFDLFGGFGSDEPSTALDLNIGDGEWDKRYLLSQEREMLGLYVSDHPLMGIEHALAQRTNLSLAGIFEAEDGTVATVGGLIADVAVKVSKKGERWAIVQLEDLAASAEINVYARSYSQFATHLNNDAVVIVKVRVDRRGDEGARLIAMEIAPADIDFAQPQGPVTVIVPQSRTSKAVLDALNGVLAAHPGGTEVHLRVSANGKDLTLLASHKVAAAAEFYADLKALLGPNCVG